jgi:hypothetical protein
VATHNEVEGHETPVSGWLPSMSVRVQDPAFAGVLEVHTLPARSTSAQKEPDAHETPAGLETASDATLHAEAPPVGSDEAAITGLKLKSTPNATQKGPCAHATCCSSSTPGRDVICQALVPPVGLVVLTTWPLVATATHTGADTHEIPRRKPGSPQGGCVSTAAGAPQAIGSVAADAGGATSVASNAPAAKTMTDSLRQSMARWSLRRPHRASDK